MKIRTSSILSVLLLLFTGTAEAQVSRTFLVKGVVDTVPNATYFVTYYQGDERISDTVSLDASRKFEYIGKIAEPSIFSLKIPNINPKFADDATVYSFWVDPGDTIAFKGKSNWKVKGIHGMVARGQIERLKPSKTRQLQDQYDARVQQAISSKEATRTGPLSKAARDEIQDSIRIEFIRAHPNDFYSMKLLYNMIRWPKDNSVFSTAEQTFEAFPAKLQSTPTGRNVAQRILVHKRTGIGQVMPDFKQRDTSSRMVHLSDFRGKYVLVDFWAGWCGPCRKEHPKLIEAYNRFSGKGFDILGVSLDSSRAKWMGAIRDDGLLWTQVSDLNGFGNSVAKQFYIHAIPDNFLLDPDGVIIARGLNGSELLEKLEEIFKDQQAFSFKPDGSPRLMH